jgi:hypothetical protein
MASYSRQQDCWKQAIRCPLCTKPPKQLQWYLLFLRFTQPRNPASPAFRALEPEIQKRPLAGLESA